MKVSLKQIYCHQIYFNSKFYVKQDGLLKEMVKVYFLSLPITSKQSAFPLIEVSASKEPVVLKEATSAAIILKLSWQPGLVYVTSFSLTRNWREGEKPATDLASSTRSSYYPHHCLQCYHFGVWRKSGSKKYG